MALGVLNNLSAIYAENNLNNTSNSLQTVLQQLSSGSKINSGADDAAGLSLVNGLQANSQALNQSETNATEGVGLLDVADGALSQVTSLLNRAITLATEASNGTLNSSQEAAANQEYTSILSEVNNIGSTTTYNQTQVFTGNTVAIYTGDSSTVGSSIDDLNIRTLSESSVGDTGGEMAYSDGATSAFLNLSTSTSNAQATDTLTGGANGSSTINVAYLVKGANGASTPATTSITVGAGTSYSNTANGLMSAINNAGLGLTASFTTQALAGVSGGGTQTGIEITGGLISVGVDPNAVATSATLNPSSITDSNLTAGQTITVMTGSTTAASVTLDQTDNTLAGLAAKINSGTGGAGGVTATVVYNSAGTATSLQIADSSSTGGALTVTSTPGGNAPNPSGVTWTAGTTGAVGVQGTANLAISGTGSNSTTQALTGSIVLDNGSNSQTYAMGSGATNVTVGSITTLSSANSTMAGLAAAISGNLGATATASSTGIAITSTATGTNITEGTSTLTAALSVGVTSNISGLAATSGTDGSTTIAMTGDGMGIDNNLSTTALTLGTSISLTNGSGSTYTFVVGNSVVAPVGTTYTSGAVTVDGLAAAINASTASGSNMTATVTNGKLVVTSTSVNTSIVASGNTLVGTLALTATPVNAGAPTNNLQGSLDLLIGTGNPANNSLNTTGSSLSGSMTIQNGAVTDTFIMGGSTTSDTANTFYTGGTTLASLQTAIGTTAANLGVTVTADNTAGGTQSGLSLTSVANGTTITATPLSGGIVDTQTVGVDAQGSLGGLGQTLTTTLSADDGGVLSAVGTNTEFAGSFTVNEVSAGSGTALSVVVGAAGKTAANDTATTVYVQGNAGVSAGTATMAQIVTALSNYTNVANAAVNTGGFDFTSSTDTNTGGLTIQAGHSIGTDSTLNISGSTLVATQAFAGANQTPGTSSGAGTVNVGNGLASIDANSINDALANGGTLTITNTSGNNSASTHQVVFTLGNSGTESGDGGAAVTTAADTMSSLMAAINAQTSMDLHASIVNGSLQIQSTALIGGLNAGTLTVSDTLSQAYGVGQVGAVGATAGTISGVTVNPGSGPTAATPAAVTINTSHGMNTAGTDPLVGQITLANSTNGTVVTFNLNSSAASTATTINLSTANSTLSGVVSAINNNVATLGMTAWVNASTGALQVQSTTTDTSITVGGTGLTDATSELLAPGTQAVASGKSTATINLTSGSLTENGQSDELTGAISVSADGSTTNYVMSGSTATFNSGTTVDLSAANSTVSGFAAALLANQGLSATVTSGAFQLQSGTYDASPISISNDSLYDTLGTGTTSSLSVVSGSAYNIGVSNVATTGVYDSSTGQAVQTGVAATTANMTSNGSKSSGIATISYSDGAGEALSGTNLLTQSASQTALIDLNLAITDVSAQDGYIGAQINTLNSVSQVLTTQQENVTSAQNAVQATDYAAATAAMSKYEILSQTGISALAQANTVQQEVTKLLQ